MTHDFENTGITLSADITDDGGATITAIGFTYTIGANPTEYPLPVTPVVQSGNYTLFVDWNDLPQDETLYFRAYATNSAGTGYSSGTLDLQNFSTDYTCSMILNLTSTSATLQGNVYDYGIYSGGSFPELSYLVTDGTNIIGSYAASYNMVTGWRADIPAGDLAPETTYYYYMYGIDAGSTQWFNFRENCPFTTPAAAVVPTVSDATMTHDFENTGITLSADITDDGGATITAIGFTYTIGANPTEYPLPVTPVVQSGNYTLFVDWNDLPQDETLYFRAYATNSAGTGYSSTTLDLQNFSTSYTCAQSNLTSTSATLESAVSDNAGLTFVTYHFVVTDGTNIIGTYDATGDATGFSAAIPVGDLAPETTYYYYPYGEESNNNQGLNLRTNCQFTTPAASGTATIDGCDITGDETTTTFIGSVLDNGGSDITECGFYWGTTDVVADLISTGTQVVSLDVVQSGTFSADLNTTDLPAEFYFVPYVINGDGTSYGDAACSSVTIEPEFSCSHSNLTATSVTLEGVEVDDMGIGFVSYGFWYGDDPEAEPIDVVATSGDASGFSVDVSGLTPGTTYIFMPYGVDSEDEKYGSANFCQFTTPVEATGTAIINGCNFGGDETTTTFIGSILTNGGSTITECGFYWGTDDNAVGLIANGTKLVAGTTVQEGEFSADIATADLPENYYFVPYVINEDGLSYGEMPCSSETIMPEFNCNSNNLTATSVTLEGAVVDAMGIEFVSFGFWYGADMESEPVTVAASGDANGFLVDITGLTPGTTYFFMPFGEDSEGHQAGSLDFCQFTTPVATELFIPNAFTPNNDGINDLFVIEGIEAYPTNKITIVNRWGNKVYEKAGYNNDWNGRSEFGVAVSKDEILPEGVYFYILEPGNGTDVIKGSIYLKKN